MDALEKLGLLAAAARTDVSCASSGSSRVRPGPGGLGRGTPAGICHSWAADGRCISLLKVLYSNHCRLDCAYCALRRSNGHQRVSFTVAELTDLTFEFYRRNYIEGLFLSSGVFAGPDETMLALIRVAEALRKERFGGYIHLKVIPGAAPELILRAGLAADRLSLNLELPSRESLALLAPDKSPATLLGGLGTLSREHLDARELAGAARGGLPGGTDLISVGQEVGLLAAEAAPPAYAPGNPPTAASPPLPAADASGFPGGAKAPSPGRPLRRVRFAPAGASTQLIVGASPESDLTILRLGQGLYRRLGLKRVYYSAYLPLNDDPRLPALESAPPLAREHRLYQADWLLRFYGFSAEELLEPARPWLDSDLDPKAAWALAHPALFPVDVQRAEPTELLRVPGLGPLSARRLCAARCHARLRLDDLRRLGVRLKRAKPFLICADHRPDPGRPEDLRLLLSDPAARDDADWGQLALPFGTLEAWG